jgi:hypothetical protein
MASSPDPAASPFPDASPTAKARRRDDVVVRESGPWSPTVLALLRHFERRGFGGAPRVHGSGSDADGNETLTFLPGTSPHPRAWHDEAAPLIGRILHDAHDAASDFVAADPVWQPWYGREKPGSHPVIGHGDPAPWNWVAGDDGLPYALIDWEYAGPVDARWELAHAIWLNAQLVDDDVAAEHGMPDAAGRAGQAAMIADGYGLPRADRIGMVDTVIEFAVASAAAEAVMANVSVTNTGGDPVGDYPLLWAVAWRARSAAWLMRHRGLLERALAR